MDTGPDTQANSSYLPFWFLPNEMGPGHPGRVYLYENQPSKTPILNYCCHTRPRKLKFKKSAPDCHYYLQRAVKLQWMGSIALWEHIMSYFLRFEKGWIMYFTVVGLPGTHLRICLMQLKGQCHEIFCFWFFSWINFPPPQSIHYQGHRWQMCLRCQRHRRQIATGINDTGGKFATGDVDTSGKYWL